MRDISRLSRFGAVCAVLLFVAAGNLELTAQSPSATSPTKSGAPEDLSHADLVEAYRSLREQLRATQAAIVNNRFEAEANNRAEAAALTEKIEAMNEILSTERRARQAETDRFDYERERQQSDIQRSNRSVIWVASAFGSVGLLAMFFTALFQWRAINRIAEVIDERPRLPDSGEYGLVAGAIGAPAGQTIVHSSQRLLSAINRMEQRIKELEQMADQPLPAAPANPPDRKQEAIA